MTASDAPCLLGQLFARLLRHHVGCVPFCPVRVALPGALLVLTVGSLRAPKRARQIVRRCEGRRRCVDAAGQPRRKFLEQPCSGSGPLTRPRPNR